MQFFSLTTQSSPQRKMRVALLALLLLLVGCHASNITANNFTLISPQVDRALEKVPGELWDAFAGIGIVIGVVIAFVGSRMIRTSSFLFGAFVGGAVGLVLVGLADFNAPSDAFVSVSIICALIMGLLVGKFLFIARYAAVLAVGIICAGMFNQYVLSYYATELESWALYVVLAVFVLVVAFVSWRFLSVALIFATAILGGFTVLMCCARLVRGPFSLVGMWADPAFLVECNAMDCWGPFIAGVAVCVLGLCYQLRKFTRVCRRKRPAPPPPPPPLPQTAKEEDEVKRKEIDAKLKELDFKLAELEAKRELEGKIQMLEEKKRLRDELRLMPIVMAEQETTRVQDVEQRDTSSTVNPLFIGGEVPPPIPPNKPKVSRIATSEASGGGFAGKWAAVENRYSVRDVQRPTSEPLEHKDQSMIEAEVGPVRDLFKDFVNGTAWAIQMVLEGMVYALVLLGRFVRKTYDAYEDSKYEKRAKTSFQAGQVRNTFS